MRSFRASSLIEKLKISSLLLIVLVVHSFWICGTALASSDDHAIPEAIKAAKSIYLDNQTGDQSVLDAASDAFHNWGRFIIVADKENADIKAVFTRKMGVDKFGNVGFTEMDIVAKGKNDPDLQLKSALHLIWDQQHRTKACVTQFRKILERKN